MTLDFQWRRWKPFYTISDFIASGNSSETLTPTSICRNTNSNKILAKTFRTLPPRFRRTIAIPFLQPLHCGVEHFFKNLSRVGTHCSGVWGWKFGKVVFGDLIHLFKNKWTKSALNSNLPFSLFWANKPRPSFILLSNSEPDLCGNRDGEDSSIVTRTLVARANMLDE